jgi:hypothetical protein
MKFSNESTLIRFAIGYSLVDITHTGDVSYINSKTRNQQRNWETTNQVLGLRTQIITISQPEKIAIDITKSNFGSNFTGIQSVWVFKFGVEQADVYSNGISPYGALEADFINVPIIAGLEETISLPTPTFTVTGPNTNIYFTALII